MPDSKARYSEFCRKGYVPLHLQSWWLEAVCGPDGWNVALAKDNGGEIIGALPYYTARRWGLKVIQLPPLTTYAGPWLRYPQEADFKNTLRSDLKKAEHSSEIKRDDEAWATVFALNERSFQLKNSRQPYTSEVFQKLHTALRQRNQSACFVASDRISGRPSAGLYLIFDDRQAAVLLTGTEPEFKSQCAIYGLFLEAIRYCAEHSLSLDFEGSMDKKIEYSFRAFGAQLVPYFQVSKSGNRWLEAGVKWGCLKILDSKCVSELYF